VDEHKAVEFANGSDPVWTMGSLLMMPARLVIGWARVVREWVDGEGKR